MRQQQTTGSTIQEASSNAVDVYGSFSMLSPWRLGVCIPQAAAAKAWHPATNDRSENGDSLRVFEVPVPALLEALRRRTQLIGTNQDRARWHALSLRRACSL